MVSAERQTEIERWREGEGEERGEPGAGVGTGGLGDVVARVDG